MAPQLKEAKLFNFAYKFEQAHDYYKQLDNIQFNSFKKSGNYNAIPAPVCNFSTFSTLSNKKH